MFLKCRSSKFYDKKYISNTVATDSFNEIFLGKWSNYYQFFG